MSHYHGIRKQYTRGTLDESHVQSDPVGQLNHWLTEALEAGCPEPTAMSLSTVGPDGRPSSRIVLMKGLDARGVTFFTNYQSRKGGQLEIHPDAALLFFWPDLERQVRVEGRVARVTAEESDAYFNSRPVASRIGALVSPQSQPVPSRAWIDEQKRLWEGKILGHEEETGEVPGLKRPLHWGGYRLDPVYFEFWQGREDRLHDRLAFTKSDDGWRLERLAP